VKTIFVWGAGGVGKSHTSIRIAWRETGNRTLMTMDPSRRLFHLLGADISKSDQMIALGQCQFRLKATDFDRLFEQLDSKIRTSDKVRHIYNQMTSGLQDFRNYLDLIQLGDELEESDDDLLLIDTPPFQEAMGFYKSMFHLQRFFDRSMVQWALRSSESAILHSAFKKVFEWLRLFSGKLAAQSLYDFIEWLSQHTDRFRRSATALEQIMKSPDTQHVFVVTPETPTALIDQFLEYFPRNQRVRIVMNRSLSKDPLPDIEHPFISELKKLKAKEIQLKEYIDQAFKQYDYEAIPLLFLGEDTPAEILEFVTA
jgi:anion-transporting  ArsA/GET3 family ATPase